MKTTFEKMHLHSIHFVNNILLLSVLLITVFLSVLSAQTLRIDSVSVDSVWNSDSSWYDLKGIQQKRESRDCKLSFVPAGTGTVQTIVSLSIDSGKTWAAQTDGYNRLFLCGIKSNLTVRILGGDKPGAAFRITGRQSKPVITANPQLIYYPNDLSTNGDLPINDLPEHPGASASVPVSLQLADSSSKGYSEVVKAYWDAMGDGTWDDSTTSLNWTWNTTVPLGESGQRRAIIAKVRDANGLWSDPETLTVQFGVGDGTLDTTANRVVTLRDSAITDSSSWSTYFFQLNLSDTVTKKMSFDPTIGIGNKYLGSIYSTANNTARAQAFHEMGWDPDNDSIIGMEYYLMAKSSAKTNFIAFLGKEGGSIRNSAYFLGTGFDKSDSVKVVWTSNSVAGQEKKNICPINFGKWYKCNVEYNVNNYTATYYIDNQQVWKHVMPSASTFGYNMFVVYRDAYGQNGMAPYYFNDFTLYKIQKKRDAILLSEGFESDLSSYKQLFYAPGQAMMSISKQYAHSGNGSLTSDSNNTSIRRMLGDGIQDSIAGLQFYMMATKKSQTNTIAGIYKMGSSLNGIFTIMGMGISNSDSLQYIYEYAPGDPVNVHKNFAAFELNKWYLCKVEYDFNTSKLAYYLDNALVSTMTIKDPWTINNFVVMRDSTGAQGPSGYYIDDVSVYKR